MKRKTENTIGFIIHKIETKQFAILSEELDESELTITSGVAFGIDEDNRIIRAMFKYEFISKDKVILILEVYVDFQIEEKCFGKQIKIKDSLVIPKDFATHLAMIAVGTARGILHEKTNGTKLNEFLMPPIDLTASIDEDIAFKFEND